MAYSLLMAFSFFSCRPKEKIPEDVLPPEKMEVVLWDMVRADQFVTDFVSSRDTTIKIDSQSIRLYQQIFRVHKISKDEFAKSFNFYKSHPSFLKPVLDSIMARKGNAPTEKVPEAQ